MDEKYTEDSIWTSLDGRETALKDLEDTHLANIIKHVTDRYDHYPIGLLTALHQTAKKRGLTRKFLARAEIPYRDSEGHWMLSNRRINDSVADWVQDIVEDVLGKSTMKVGEVIRHPDGRLVKVLDGQYWGERGLSNFWTWQEVLPDGTMGETEQGYGW